MKTSVPARGALLAGLIFLCDGPALRGGFIFDDNVTLTENPLIRGAGGFSRLWFSRAATDYWPVTASAFRTEWDLWGARAAGYHATNLALHLAACLLFWGLLRRLRLPGAYFAVLLFAVHPVNAESVVWITQQKNLLAMLFFLLSIYGWVRGEEVGRVIPNPPFAPSAFAGIPRRIKDNPPYLWYSLSLLSFILAMLSKGSVVTLPLILLGLVAWRRRPNARDLARLTPFVFVAVGLAVWEAQFRTVNSLAGLGPSDWLSRLAGAGAALAFYFRQAWWPRSLMFVYPPWTIATTALRWWLPLAAEVGLTALLWRSRRSGGRPYLYAWGFFVVALLPVLGFVPVGYMRYSPVADHYEHLALLGVTALAATLGVRLAPGPAGKVGAGLLVALLGMLTWRQSRMYADARTLYLTTLERNPACWLAENNLGALSLQEGKPDEAVGWLESALRLHPDSAETENNLGLAWARTGRLPQAVDCYAQSLRLDPGFSRAENNWGVALARMGRLPEATGHFQQAVRIDPEYFEGQLNLGRALALAGDSAGALEHYVQACRLNPDDAAARRDLAGLEAAREKSGARDLRQ